MVSQVVKLLTQEPSLDTKRINKFGESALDVIGSRAKERQTIINEGLRSLIHYIFKYRYFYGIVLVIL